MLSNRINAVERHSRNTSFTARLHPRKRTRSGFPEFHAISIKFASTRRNSISSKKTGWTNRFHRDACYDEYFRQFIAIRWVIQPFFRGGDWVNVVMLRRRRPIAARIHAETKDTVNIALSLELYRATNTEYTPRLINVWWFLITQYRGIYRENISFEAMETPLIH